MAIWRRVWSTEQLSEYEASNPLKYIIRLTKLDTVSPKMVPWLVIPKGGYFSVRRYFMLRENISTARLKHTHTHTHAQARMHTHKRTHKRTYAHRFTQMHTGGHTYIHRDSLSHYEKFLLWILSPVESSIISIHISWFSVPVPYPMLVKDTHAHTHTHTHTYRERERRESQIKLNFNCSCRFHLLLPSFPVWRRPTSNN